MNKLTAVCITSIVLMSSSAFAHKQGDILLRAGFASVQPDESSGDVLNAGEFKINGDTQFGFTAGYMLTENIGVELLAASPFKHKVALAGLGTLATVRHLPPSLMIQYYLGDSTSVVRPYAGVGMNYTLFFDEQFNHKAYNTGLTKLKLKDSWGVAAQVGVDVLLNENVFVNGSVWWMDIDTKVDFEAGGNKYRINTDIDPWVYMLSVGFRF